MNIDDVLRMAREAGIYQKEATYNAYLIELKKFAGLIAAAEREECTKLCDKYE